MARPYNNWSRRSRMVHMVVLLRDKYKCRLCGKATTKTHHCIPVVADPLRRSFIELDQPWNLITVCEDCHNKVHDTSDHSLFVKLWRWAETNYRRLKGETEEKQLPLEA